MILAKYQVDIKQFVILKKLIKKLVEDYIKKKPNIFLCSKIKHGLMLLFNEDVLKDLLCKVSIEIMYYRLLRYKEILFIQIKDVAAEEHVNANFPHETKRCVKGFKFMILSWLNSAFKKYIG